MKYTILGGSMMTPLQYLSYAREFTEAYRSASDKYTREVACLKVQLPIAVLPMRRGDLIAGRYDEPALGFSPQSWASLGYYIRDDYFEKLLLEDAEKSSALSATSERAMTPEEREELRQIITFWKLENTQNKIYQEYPEEIRTKLTHTREFTTPTTAFALYRLGGIHMDFSKLLEIGIPGMKQCAADQMDKNPAFYQGIIDILDLYCEVCLGYAEEAEAKVAVERDEEYKKILKQIAENMRTIVSDKPHTFWQALQLSFLYILVSGARNYGRMDLYLGSFLKRDLDSGELTWEEAVEILLNVWSLMDERALEADTRVILGGKDLDDLDQETRACAECFEMLAMETTRRSRTVVPQLTLRCHSGMNPDIYEKALQVIGEGTTYPMLYNDDVNIPAVMEGFGLDEETAKKYLPYGCGEYVIYNQSLGTPSGTLNMLYGLNDLIYGKKQALLEAKDFEEFYQIYIKDMADYIHWLAVQEKMEYDIAGREAPYLFFSVIYDDCMAKGLPILEGGIRYLGGTLETYGNVNTSDSLTAIKRVIYEEKSVTAQELTDALSKNFEGYEDLQHRLRALPKYGNDEEEADCMAVRLHEDICNMVRNEAVKVGLASYLIVIINNSMNTTFGLATGASADGRGANVYMANANNPMSGMDKKGVTAVLNSLVKLKVNRHAGSVQNMRFNPEMFGKNLPQLKGLLQGYFKNGGSQAMITVLNRGDLEAAMREPEKYRNLIVRVGGFSARFVNLDKEVQKELLARTLY